MSAHGQSVLTLYKLAEYVHYLPYKCNCLHHLFLQLYVSWLQHTLYFDNHKCKNIETLSSNVLRSFKS